MSTLKAPEAEPAAAKSPAGKAVADTPAKSGTKRKRTWALLVLAAVALFGVGFLTAALTAEPRASDEYIALEGTAQQTAEERDSIDAQRLRLEEKLADQQAAMTERENAVALQEAAVKKQEDGLKTREAAVSGAEQKKAANTVSDGTWVVGVDIEPGTYKPKADVGSRCYWGIYASGTNGDDIIANDIPGGGLPSVTLAAGQDFKTARCGSWTKQ